ncbi:TPA: CheY-P-specific phosphatase CheC [candidate division WOR-3 bacterium]|jgi:chemotaxis protein CheC|uniref:CheY-P-specific phosphatase CheC n=1 Tax=candidate division WOR-3 bacterium TaxID=2052148 RepID=A0A350H921_UNCW3|nr:CheY-P-specific phosphatase CheC [candidate division WOR-3 bacterium]
MDLKDLKDFHLDGIKEISNIGGGHAATVLSQLINRKVMVSVPKVHIISSEDVYRIINNEDEIVTGCLVKFLGDLTGRTLLIFPRDQSMLLVDMVMGKEEGTTTILSEIEQSAIKEVANIVISSYLTALSDFLNMLILPSVPNLVIDVGSAVLTSAYIDFSVNKDIVFCVETEFSFEEDSQNLKGYLILLPDPVSLKKLLDFLNR